MLKENSSTRLSFLGWLFGWFLVMIYPTQFIYLIFSFLTPLNESLLNFSDIIIIRFLAIMMTIQLTLPYLLGTLPFKPIDLSLKSILRSILHIFFYICSLPILILSIIILYIFISSSPVYTPGQLGLLTMSPFLGIPILIWIVISLFLSEFVFGKNSSQTLNKLRNNNKVDRTTSVHYESNNESDKKRIFSNRGLMISFGLPMILIFTENLVIGRYNFPLGVIIFLFCGNLLFFLFLLPINRFILEKQRISFKFFDHYYERIFGKNDISQKAMGWGLTVSFIIFWSSLAFFREMTIPGILLFIFLDIIEIGIFILTLWINQIKNHLDSNHGTIT